MNFIAIDFETANQYRNSACQIGLVRFEEGKPVETYESLIKPPFTYFKPEFFDIHGIIYDDVKDAKTFDVLWQEEIRPFIFATSDKPILVAHNASFDMSVLQKTLEHYEIEFPNVEVLCSCQTARKTWPDFENHRLSTLADKFGIVYNEHDALDDALTCGKVLCMALGERNS